MRRDLLAEKKIFLEWLDTPKVDRQPKTAKTFCKLYHLNVETASKWKKEAENYTSRDYFLLKQKEIDKGMVNAVVSRGNAQMAKVIKQLTGELVEKSEVTHKGLSADDIDRINKKADAELEEFYRGIRAGGVQEVSPGSSLLSS